MMRVVAGAYKGQHDREPGRGDAVRPTAGPGARGRCSACSARSRACACSTCSPGRARSASRRSRAGAQAATFVDSDAACIRAVGENLDRLGIEDARLLFRSDALAFLRGAARHGDRWDLVFCDPPYRLAHRLADDLDGLLEPVLEPEARIVCESSVKQPLKLALPIETERRYGDTLIVIHQYKPEPERQTPLSARSRSVPAPTTRSRSGTST